MDINIARSVLQNYFRVVEDNAMANYLKCKHVPVQFTTNESTQQLWKKHAAALERYNVQDEQPAHTLLDLKIELADRVFQQCHFCEHQCQVNRKKSTGWCNVQEPHVASEFLHFGEESILIPSHTVFFSGCTFGCVYCQNWDLSQRITGFYIEPKKLAQRITDRMNQGSKNVNWVGGDPTPNLPYILRVLSACKSNVSQVWNSNMYCSQETMNLLNGIIDVYLTDFKYGNDECAKRLSNIDKYMKTVTRNHKTAYNQAEIIIRHLVLPNHISCCSQPIFNWIQEHIPGVLVNVMDQYRPQYKAQQYKDINRNISSSEYQHAKKLAKEYELNIL